MSNPVPTFEPSTIPDVVSPTAPLTAPSLPDSTPDLLRDASPFGPPTGPAVDDMLTPATLVPIPLIRAALAAADDQTSPAVAYPDLQPPVAPSVADAPDDEPTPQRNPKLVARATFAVCATILAGTAWFAYGSLTGGDADVEAIPPAVTDPVVIEAADPFADAFDAGEPLPVGTAPPIETSPPNEVPSNPLVEPINDAEEVVDQIADNSQEDEALDQLGLDAVGQPAVPGYSFVVTDPSGLTLEILVDAVNGDYSIEMESGASIRSIDGDVVTRSSPDDSWTSVDRRSLGILERLGLDRVIVLSDVVTPEISPWMSITSDVEFDDEQRTIYRVDIATINAEAPDELATWASSFGIDARSLVSATSAPIDIETVIDPETNLLSYWIEAADGSTATAYRLQSFLDERPDITL